MRSEKNNIVPFNRKSEYSSEILPLVQNLKVACVLNNIPFFCCFAVQNTAEKTLYEYDGSLPGSMGIDLSDNNMTKHLLVANGFDIKPHGLEDVFSDAVQDALIGFDQIHPAEEEEEEEEEEE